MTAGLDTRADEGATGRGAWEGIGYGILAGVVFAIAEIVLAAATGQSALAPFRMFASVVWGRAAFEAAPGTVFIVGAVVNVVLAALFGLVFGLISSTESAVTRASIGGQLVLGAVFGFLLWVLNFEVIARFAYPWFLESPTRAWQIVVHVVFFGIPLGLMYGASERISSSGHHARPPLTA